jgi:hypothetical protein
MPERLVAKKSSWYVVALFFVALVLLSPIILILALLFIIPWLYARFVQRSRLLCRVKNEWLPQNKFILFVYSDNQLWKEYAEKKIVPKIKPVAVILNWSQRKDWIKANSLEAKLFRNFQWGREYIWQNNVRMGGQTYNHMAIIFKSWDKPRVISFWEAFKDYEFGKENNLTILENELYSYFVS